MSDEKFEIRNQKSERIGARGAHARISPQGVSLAPFGFLISNFEFSPSAHAPLV